MFRTSFLYLRFQDNSQVGNSLGDKPTFDVARRFRAAVFNTPRDRGGSRMSRRVKEFVDIGEHVSLEELIGKLAAIRDELPEGCEAEMRLRGAEGFGRRTP